MPSPLYDRETSNRGQAPWSLLIPYWRAGRMPRHWFEQTPRATIPTRAQSIEASLSFCLIYSRRIAALEAPPVGLQASAPGRFHTVRFASDEIGRASGRVRVCQSVAISVVGGSLKK